MGCIISAPNRLQIGYKKVSIYTMNRTTYTKRMLQLLHELSTHPHKEELLQLMLQQRQEDSSLSVMSTVQ